jgi:hypothetical protein
MDAAATEVNAGYGISAMQPVGQTHRAPDFPGTPINRPDKKKARFESGLKMRRREEGEEDRPLQVQHHASTCVCRTTGGNTSARRAITALMPVLRGHPVLR